MSHGSRRNVGGEQVPEKAPVLMGLVKQTADPIFRVLPLKRIRKEC